MLIKSMSLRGFMSHKSTDVQFPDRGVILVTGENGRGKSSLIEAVSYTIWGKTLRGTDPRTEEGYSKIQFFDGLTVRRGWSDGKSTLKIDGHEDFESITKAQSWLEKKFGPWEVWRRSCVFSSTDAAHFTLASDGERKRLLESILGLDLFDEALDRCRADAKVVALQQSQLLGEAMVTKTRVEELQKRVKSAQEMVSELPEQVDLAALAHRGEAVKKLVVDCRAEIDQKRQSLNTASFDLQAKHREASRLKAEAADLDDEECPICGREWEDKSLRAAKRAELVAQAEKLSSTNDNEVSRHKVELQELEEELRSLQDQLLQLSAKFQSLKATEKARLNAFQALGEAKDSLNIELERVSQQALDIAAISLEAKTFNNVISVLGLKGVRASVLQTALSGIELVANAWLSKIAKQSNPLNLKLLPYTERKTGGVSDAISLEITGAGAGKGYKASSGGERRRIDVALLLALAEVSRASYGQGSSTLFADEVFDSLDAEGSTAVCSAISDLAQDRPVIIISHSRELAKLLMVDLHLHVTQKGVEVL